MVKDYDAKQVSVLCNGVPMEGFADGTFISIEIEADEWTKTVGADGKVSRGKSNDYTSIITITLQQTSPSNDVLSVFLALDRNGNAGKFSVLVKDNNGTTIMFFPDAWIQKPPTMEDAKEVGERAWAIATGQPGTYFHGGNNT